MGKNCIDCGVVIKTWTDPTNFPEEKIKPLFQALKISDSIVEKMQKKDILCKKCGNKAFCRHAVVIYNYNVSPIEMTSIILRWMLFMLIGVFCYQHINNNFFFKTNLFVYLLMILFALSNIDTSTMLFDWYNFYYKEAADYQMVKENLRQTYTEFFCMLSLMKLPGNSIDFDFATIGPEILLPTNQTSSSIISGLLLLNLQPSSTSPNFM